MRPLTKVLLGGVAFVVLLLIAVPLVGLLLPAEHVATASLDIARPPEEVWAVLTDFAAHRSWREDLDGIERLPDREGRQVWREVNDFGALTYEVDALDPPRRFVTRIADPALPFSGSWTYEIEPTRDGCRVTITERGRITNPVFRLLSRFFMEPTATIDRYLGYLATRLR